MIDTNKKFNVILIIISGIMLVVIFYLIFLINRHENARIYFNIEEIEGINWYSKDPVIDFIITDGTCTFIIDGEIVLDKERVRLNNETGEITRIGNKDEVMYLRSVGEANIIIWYEKAEYRLDKEVINR